MQIDTPRAAAYVGAGAAVGGVFASLPKHRSPMLIGFGVATGLAVGGLQTAVHEASDSGLVAIGASVLGGAALGAMTLGRLAPQGATPVAARGIGAAIGGTIGFLTPIAAGMVLAQLRPQD